jgi:ABC-type dipeptide/oligopeptide/nickel transport system permease subunit
MRAFVAAVLSLRSRNSSTPRSSAARRPRSCWRHILPNVINVVVVLLTLDVGRSSCSSSLAFLGLGLPLPRRLGATIAGSKVYLQMTVDFPHAHSP